MSLVDPFKWFPRGVTEVSVWRYSAKPRVEPVCLQEGLPAIVKRRANSDMVAVDYGSHEGEHSIHVKPSDFGEGVPSGGVDWLDLVVETSDGRRFLVVGVSVGDDFDRGLTVFWRLYATVFNRNTL